MDQQQQLRRKLQERKRMLGMQQPVDGSREVSPNERQRPVSPPRPEARPASPPEPRLASQSNWASPTKRQQRVTFGEMPTNSAGSRHPTGKVRPLEGGPFGGGSLHANGRDAQSPVASGEGSSHGSSQALAAAGRSIGSVGKAAGSAVAVVASTAGSVAAAAADTAGSAACVAAAVAGSAASAAASAAGCLPRTQSTPSRIDLLREVPLFSGIARAQMEWIAETMVIVDAAADQVVVQQGDPAREMYVVESGRLQVTVNTAIGSNSVGVIKEYTAGAFFGELAILSETESMRSATVTAVEPTRLLSLRREGLAELLKHQGLYHTLSKVQLFSGLSILTLHQIGNNMSRRKVVPDEIIIQQNDAGNEMFVVESGRLEASVITADGKNIGVVKTYGGGEYFGELALISDAPRSATVTATDEGSLLVLERGVVNELLNSGTYTQQQRMSLHSTAVSRATTRLLIRAFCLVWSICTCVRVNVRH